MNIFNQNEIKNLDSTSFENLKNLVKQETERRTAMKAYENVSKLNVGSIVWFDSGRRGIITIKVTDYNHKRVKGLTIDGRPTQWTVDASLINLK